MSASASSPSSSSSSSSASVLGPFLSGSDLSIEASANLEVLMGVFNAEISPLELKEAILFAASNSVLSDVQLQSLIEAGERPPMVLKFDDIKESINICLDFADAFIGGTLPDMKNREHPYKHHSAALAVQYGK